MRSVFLTTRTNETSKYWQSLINLNWGEVDTVVYDLPGTTDAGLLSAIKEKSPDLIVYIGARWGQQPSITLLSKLTNSVCPTVHFCSDAADIPWHDLLRQYHERGAFTVQLAIDGSDRWPSSAAGLTLLTPVDPLYFSVSPQPHAKRAVMCGWGGNAGSGDNSQRSATLAYLLQQKLLSLRIRSNLPFTYESYCDFLATCRICLNIAHSGTEAVMHVKGRVVEAALAGCCLLENKNSPTRNWFEAGVDYLEYENPSDAARIITLMNDKPDVTEAMGSSLRKKVLERHSPRKFWGAVLERIGMPVPA
jgi:hypothetical protein